MTNEFKDLAEIMQNEEVKIKEEWYNVKKELNGLIEHKYFDFVESHNTYNHEGIVNVIEVDERTSGYKNYQHFKEVDSDTNRLYVKHKTKLETYKCNSKYEGKSITYLVWQTTGYIEDDYSGYLLLPMLDGRFWKVSYTC